MQRMANYLVDGLTQGCVLGLHVNDAVTVINALNGPVEAVVDKLSDQCPLTAQVFRYVQLQQDRVLLCQTLQLSDNQESHRREY